MSGGFSYINRVYHKNGMMSYVMKEESQKENTSYRSKSNNVGLVGTGTEAKNKQRYIRTGGNIQLIGTGGKINVRTGGGTKLPPLLEGRFTGSLLHTFNHANNKAVDYNICLLSEGERYTRFMQNMKAKQNIVQQFFDRAKHPNYSFKGKKAMQIEQQSSNPIPNPINEKARAYSIITYHSKF